MTESAAPRSNARVKAFARKWAFALVPLVGLWELGAHIVQVRSVPTENDWLQARGAVETEWQEGDLVVFAPNWSDPLGREYFGSTLVPMRDEARPDESRYTRAIEVSMRGQHDPAFEGWSRRDRRKVGPFTITLFQNPSPAHVLDDLVSHLAPDHAHVSRQDARGSNDCNWTRGVASAGSLGTGPAMPGDRFVCPGGSFVGESIIFEPTYHPRRCLYSPPAGHNVVTHIDFHDVAFGSALHGHAGMQYESENAGGSDTTLTWRAGDQVLGKVVYRDGDGWKSFELSTPPDLAGKHGDLSAEVSTAGGGRQFCFEADTR